MHHANHSPGASIAHRVLFSAGAYLSGHSRRSEPGPRIQGLHARPARGRCIEEGAGRRAGAFAGLGCHAGPSPLAVRAQKQHAYLHNGEEKSRITLALNRSLERDGSLWQHGFHDRAIRRDEDLPAVARYIVANPLRAGLVEKIGDYPLWDAVWL